MHYSILADWDMSPGPIRLLNISVSHEHFASKAIAKEIPHMRAHISSISAVFQRIN